MKLLFPRPPHPSSSNHPRFKKAFMSNHPIPCHVCGKPYPAHELPHAAARGEVVHQQATGWAFCYPACWREWQQAFACPNQHPGWNASLSGRTDTHLEFTCFQCGTRWREPLVVPAREPVSLEVLHDGSGPEELAGVWGRDPLAQPPEPRREVPACERLAVELAQAVAAQPTESERRADRGEYVPAVEAWGHRPHRAGCWWLWLPQLLNVVELVAVVEADEKNEDGYRDLLVRRLGTDQRQSILDDDFAHARWLFVPAPNPAALSRQLAERAEQQRQLEIARLKARLAELEGAP